MPATPAWPPKSAPRLFVTGPLGEGAAVQLAAFAREMNHALPDEEAEAFIRRDQAKTIALRQKAGYPLADWKAAIAKVPSLRRLGT